MEAFALSGLINGIVALTISFLVFSRNHKNIANKTFSLFALAVAIWSFGFWQWLLAADSNTALFWIKLFTLPSILIPALYFHWIVSLLEVNSQKLYKTILYVLYSISIILIPLLLSTKLLIQGTEQRLFFPFWPIPGSLYLFFVGIYFAAVIYSLILLFKNLKCVTDKTKRKQLLFVFWGVLVGFGGGATTFLLWYEVPVPPYGNFLVSIGLFLWGYAAAKYHLFDIKAIAAEILTFIIWVAVFIRLVLADSWQDRLQEAGLFVLVVILGIMIIRSVLKEIEQKEKLIELDKLKNEFLSFASHQVKTPMTVIKGYSELIRDGSFGEISDKLDETVTRIYEMAERTLRLVGNFLDLRKIEEGKMNYQFGRLDIVEMVKNIVEELRVIANSKGLVLSVQLPAQPIHIKADEEKLRQVVLNLVENSIKYTKKGFVNVKVKKDKESILISVNDSGYGISPELLPNLFKRFSRDSKTAKEIRGTGLGLYIAKEIIETHHGKIWAESKGENKGSTFYVKVPG